MSANRPSPKSLAIRSETWLLSRIAAIASKSPASSVGALQLGMGDDAALFRPRLGTEIILTCDWFLEGTHFLRDKHPADSVGWKCLARALSDVAAMGGAPRCFLLSLALPISEIGGWLTKFLRGLRRASRAFDCPLAGGDTTRRSEILLNVTVIGEISQKHAVFRSGARPGDLVYVSGRLGEAELGLCLLRQRRGRANFRDSHLRKHLYPEPRLALGRWLAEERLATAMMDLSDGLSADLPRLCKASGVGARIEADKIPAVRVPGRGRGARSDPLSLALHGGDDYELLFTISPKNANRVPRAYRGISLTAIGVITKKRGVLLVDSLGQQTLLANRGWDPFRTRMK
jgi:thiamine-monophosphate kinase